MVWQGSGKDRVLKPATNAGPQKWMGGAPLAPRFGLFEADMPPDKKEKELRREVRKLKDKIIDMEKDLDLTEAPLKELTKEDAAANGEFKKFALEGLLAEPTLDAKEGEPEELALLRMELR